VTLQVCGLKAINNFLLCDIDVTQTIRTCVPSIMRACNLHPTQTKVQVLHSPGHWGHGR
jgi:hypothetical protein